MWLPDCVQSQVFEEYEEYEVVEAYEAYEEYRENVNPSPEV